MAPISRATPRALRWSVKSTSGARFPDPSGVRPHISVRRKATERMPHAVALMDGAPAYVLSAILADFLQPLSSPHSAEPRSVAAYSPAPGCILHAAPRAQ